MPRREPSRRRPWAQSGKLINHYSPSASRFSRVYPIYRTVAAFGGQRAEVERFRERLVDARQAGILRGFMTAVGCAAFWFVFYSSYGLGFWYGVKLIIDEREACEVGEQCVGGVRYDPSSLIKVKQFYKRFMRSG